MTRAGHIGWATAIGLIAAGCSRQLPPNQLVPIAAFDSTATDQAFRAIAAASPTDSFSKRLFATARYSLRYRLLGPSELHDTVVDR